MQMHFANANGQYVFWMQSQIRQYDQLTWNKSLRNMIFMLFTYSGNWINEFHLYCEREMLQNYITRPVAFDLFVLLLTKTRDNAQNYNHMWWPMKTCQMLLRLNSGKHPKMTKKIGFWPYNIIRHFNITKP